MEMLFILQLTSIIRLNLCVRQWNKLNLTWTFFVVEHVMNTCDVHDIHWFCVTVSRNQIGCQHHKTRMSATERNFGYTKLLEGMNVWCLPFKDVYMNKMLVQISQQWSYSMQYCCYARSALTPSKLSTVPSAWGRLREGTNGTVLQWTLSVLQWTFYVLQWTFLVFHMLLLFCSGNHCELYLLIDYTLANICEKFQ